MVKIVKTVKINKINVLIIDLLFTSFISDYGVKQPLSTIKTLFVDKWD